MEELNSINILYQFFLFYLSLLGISVVMSGISFLVFAIVFKIYEKLTSKKDRNT